MSFRIVTTVSLVILFVGSWVNLFLGDYPRAFYWLSGFSLILAWRYQTERLDSGQ